MAVHQGTRLGALGVTAVGEAPYRAARRAVPAAPRIRPAALLVATILVATILGLLYLTQTLGATASGVEISSLAAKRDGYERQLLTQRSIISQKTTDASIEEWARDNGLVDLDDALIVRIP